MRRKSRQKAITKQTSHILWNRMWQVFCPWVSGVDVSPRRGRRLYSTVAAAVIAGTLNFTVASVQASDLNNEGQIVLASLSSTVPGLRDSATPDLFGASEQRHSDIRPFTKWTGVLKRFKRDFSGSLNAPEVQDWMKFISSQKDASDEDKIEAVNNYMNKIPFSPDSKNYGTKDYWATPMEFLKRGKGDCEDYAFAKYVTLRALGFKHDQMRLSIVFDSVMRMPHALLVVYVNDEAKVLDSQNPAIMDSADISRYKPIYSISQVAWWRHQ